jgi:hypothetical protein
MSSKLGLYDKRELPLVALNVNDAARAAGVSRNQIFRAMNDGALCGRKFGKSLLIEVCELQRWVESLPYRGRRPISADVSGAPKPQEARVRRSGGRKPATPEAQPRRDGRRDSQQSVELTA